MFKPALFCGKISFPLNVAGILYQYLRCLNYFLAAYASIDCIDMSKFIADPRYELPYLMESQLWSPYQIGHLDRCRQR